MRGDVTALWGDELQTPLQRLVRHLIRRSEQQTVSSWAQGEAWAPRLARWRFVWTCWVRLGSAGKLPHNRLGSIERGPGAGPPEHDRWSVSARRVTVVDLI